MPLNVTRGEEFLRPDASRLLLRAFDTSGPDQARNLLSRVLALPAAEVSRLVEELFTEFGPRRPNLKQALQARFQKVWPLLPSDQDLDEDRQLLIASYFFAEYAIESAALFNPSIVPHPDQFGVEPGSLRIILSLRAIGEGHISSITFRSGVVDSRGAIEVAPPSPIVLEPQIIPNPVFEKPLFRRKLNELGLTSTFIRGAIDRLEARFTLADLRATLESERSQRRREGFPEEGDSVGEDKIMSLALSNYEVQFDAEDLSQRIIFPFTPSQRNGIEDARFVKFEDPESPCYYATYTAYDGRLVLPQMIETEDFRRFRFSTLNGPAVRNKGMALFPRKVRGSYAMLSRQDNENIYMMYSDNPHFWYESELILKPKYPWELVQLGNCGAPIETEAGWLVISHGVGAMRKYCLGAFLLDIDDPSKVLGRLSEPLVVPSEEERTGYLPNIVYTCGAIAHNGNLVLPYGISDYATRFAHIPIREVLAAMQ